MKEDPVLRAVDAQDLPGLKRALASASKVPARAMTRAGALAWKAGLDALLRAGGDPNASFKGYRPLHSLIQEKPHEGGSSTPERVACVAWLVGKGADPELRAAWPSARALLVAAFTGEKAYVDALVAAGARVDGFVESALGDAKAVERRLARDSGFSRARDGEDGLTALQVAASSRMGKSDAKRARGLVACALLLLDAGAEPDAETPSWSHAVVASSLAIGAGQAETLALLLERGADPTAALSAAAWNGTDEMLDLVLARGAGIDAPCDGGKPVLNQLVRWGQFERARRLLARGASPNVPDERGYTAMHYAASRGNAAIFADLVAKGGDADRLDAEGDTPNAIVSRAGIRRTR
jgi:ankyrin repeat protein